MTVFDKNLQSLQPGVGGSKHPGLHVFAETEFDTKQIGACHKACHSILYSLVIKKLTEKSVKEAV